MLATFDYYLDGSGIEIQENGKKKYHEFPISHKTSTVQDILDRHCKNI